MRKTVKCLIPVALATFGIGILLSTFYTRSYSDPEFHTGKPMSKTEVAIVPMSGIKDEEVEHVKASIEHFYGFTVTVLPRQGMPRSAYYKPRTRYKAGLVLDYLLETKPSRFDKVVALTNKDISTKLGKYDDWGVIGMAYLSRDACVVSTHRLGKRKVSDSRYRDRLAKATLHELGHSLGLPHCGTASCFMVDAGGKVSTIDRAEMALCDRCRRAVGLAQKL